MSPRDAGNKVGIGLWPAKVCRLCRLRSIQCKAHDDLLMKALYLPTEEI